MSAAIPMILFCPNCGLQHVDKGVWASILHASHKCEECSHIWRPANVETVGIHDLGPLGKGDSLPIKRFRASSTILNNGEG